MALYVQWQPNQQCCFHSRWCALLRAQSMSMCMTCHQPHACWALSCMLLFDALGALVDCSAHLLGWSQYSNMWCANLQVRPRGHSRPCSSIGKVSQVLVRQ